MATKYRKPTSRATDSENSDDGSGVSEHLQLSLPIAELLGLARQGVESLVGEIGLLVLNGLIEDEVEGIVGPRGKPQESRTAYRWGREKGYVVFAGQKIPLERPRVRDVEGNEVSLQRYSLFQDEERLEESVSDRVLRRVSTRDYEGVVDVVCDGYGVKKSSVSRNWKAASTKQIEALMSRRLDDFDLFGVMIDGIHFHDYTLVVALGFASDGTKRVLGLWLGATENATLCTALLTDLRERGLRTDRRTLFVLDGSKALRRAVVDVFGKNAVIQRCQQHKLRNVLSYVPKTTQSVVRHRLKSAWSLTDHEEALRALRNTAEYLEGISAAAANSLREGMEETLTLHELRVSPALRRTLSTTNPIESCFSRSRDLAGNVKRWRNEDMVQRWSGAILLEAEKKFRRIKGHRELPLLVATLREEEVDTVSSVA